MNATLIFLTMPLLLISLQASAFSMSSKMTLGQDGELTKTLQIQCSHRDVLCQQTCGQPAQCEIPETLCEDCATESSAILHTIFTDISRVFKSEHTLIEQNQISQFFKTKKFMTVSHDSFLNLFTPEKKDELKYQFESLCYIQNIQSAILLTTLNLQNQVDQLVGVICQDHTGKSVLLPIQFNPLFSNKRLYFWTTPTELNTRLK